MSRLRQPRDEVARLVRSVEQEWTAGYRERALWILRHLRAWLFGARRHPPHGRHAAHQLPLPLPRPVLTELERQEAQIRWERAPYWFRRGYAGVP